MFTGSLEALADIARDLTASLSAHDRHERVLAAVRRVVPCDAACLMALEGDELVPLAGYGLAAGALERRYARGEHPRLDAVLNEALPVRFPADSSLPDPFDGALLSDPEASHRVHACLGCALHDGDTAVGALVVDALSPHAFDELDPELLRMLAAIAGAALRTARLIDALETTVRRQSQDLRDRARDARVRGFLGVSAAARRVVDDVALVAATSLPVLIVGETGVGKELVAAQVHAMSPRRDRPLVAVNCAALPHELAESELFGHVRGAFTGATAERAGKFELADNATLFLDEIGELPLTLQPKLLRAFQQGEVQRVGSDRVVRVDVRIVTATNRDLEAEVAAGRFRADLYHRLAAYPLCVPPLRERLDDLPILADHLLRQHQRRMGVPEAVLDAGVLPALRAYSWPGNVRELDNVLARAMLRALRDRPRQGRIEIRAVHLSLDTSTDSERRSAPPPAQLDVSLADQLEAFRRRVITDTVASHEGNWAAAARSLGLHRANLHSLAKRLGLKD
jgi:anaerobic nitric oxide reductase transcription regulator